MKMEIPGSLIVCGSYAGDLEAIVKVLNTFEFDQDWDKDERFVVVDGRIETDRYLIENAGAMPYSWYEEGREEEDEPNYEPSLEEVSNAIAKDKYSTVLTVAGGKGV
jgi:hypothetical protein